MEESAQAMWLPQPAHVVPSSAILVRSEGEDVWRGGEARRGDERGVRETEGARGDGAYNSKGRLLCNTWYRWEDGRESTRSDI
jgi:hypothetical protein